jgi:hypothetical protein
MSSSANCLVKQIEHVAPHRRRERKPIAFGRRALHVELHAGDADGTARRIGVGNRYSDSRGGIQNVVRGHAACQVKHQLVGVPVEQAGIGHLPHADHARTGVPAIGGG